MADVDTLIRQLAATDSQPWTSTGVVDALVEAGGEVVPALCRYLQQGVDGRGRCNALLALRRLGDRRAAAPVARLLQSANDQVRSLAATTLGELGDTSRVPALCTALLRPDSEFRRRVLEALARLGDARAVPVLFGALADWGGPGSDLHRNVLEALARVCGPEAVPALADALRGGNQAVRYEAAVLLGRIAASNPDPAALRGTFDAAAILALSEPDYPNRTVLRGEALRVFGPAAVPNLIGALHYEGAARARAALVSIGPPAVPGLCAALDPSTVPQPVRRQAAEILGRIGDRNAVPALCRCLEDSSPAVRGAAVYALGDLGDPSAAPALEAALNSDSAGFRICVAVALVRVGVASAAMVPPLVEALRLPEAGLQVEAARGLAKIAAQDPLPGLRAAVPPLRRLLAPWSPASEEARAAYRRALGAIEDATAAARDLPRPGATSSDDAGKLPIPTRHTGWHP